LKEILASMTFEPKTFLIPGGGGVLPIMAYMGRFRPKGEPFSCFRYIIGKGFHELKYMKG